MKDNFVNHGLEVDEKALRRIFKSVAVERKRHDPCNDLSLYEFSIFSKKAAKDFKKLMNNIKRNMTIQMQKNNTSTLNLGKQLQGTKSILPEKTASYIKYLPADFNPLMNHFKDEERRSDIRQNLTETLDDIMKIGSSQKKLEEILEKNNANMEELIHSHFPKDDLDEEVRRMFAQVKSKANYFRFKTLSTDIKEPRLAIDKNKKVEEVSEQFKSKVRKRFNSLVTKAKEQGRIEAQHMLTDRASLLQRHVFTPTNSSSTAKRTVRLKTAMSDRKKTRPILVKPYMKKILEENLILRPSTAATNSFRSINTWRQQTARRELPLISSFNPRSGIKCFSSMSNREPLIKI